MSGGGNFQSTDFRISYFWHFTFSDSSFDDDAKLEKHFVSNHPQKSYFSDIWFSTSLTFESNYAINVTKLIADEIISNT